jgi:hypothetical protein
LFNAEIFLRGKAGLEVIQSMMLNPQFLYHQTGIIPENDCEFGQKHFTRCIPKAEDHTGIRNAHAVGK